MIARHRSLSPSDDRIPFLPRPLSLLAADEQMRVAVLARGAWFIQCEPSRIASITMQATIDNTMKTSMLPRIKFARCCSCSVIMEFPDQQRGQACEPSTKLRRLLEYQPRHSRG